MRASHLLQRVARMSAAELSHRVTTSVRREASRLAQRTRGSAWQRATLADALAPVDALVENAAAHLTAGRADEAHRALSQHFARRPRRWPIGPGLRGAIARAVVARDPRAPADAAARADRVVAGRFDLLGYRDLSFHPPLTSAGIDWHLDPVHGRRAPLRFWSEVPYLGDACGDHKIIWELNRHQHWLALGRASWLTGDPRYRAAFVAQHASWMAANPPLTGINWASMLELGLRAISWIWALHLFVEAPAPGRAATASDALAEPPWTVDLLLGVDRQLQLVEQNLSTFFSPNTHLIGEALALYVAGRALPELRRSGAWAQLGRRVLIEEMGRQIAADGGHVERSFHYHRYTLDFYLLALTMARTTGDDPRPFAEAVHRLAAFARLAADDTGRLARIGDDDGGQAFPICGRACDDASDSLALAAWLLREPALAVTPPTEEVIWMSGGAAACDTGWRGSTAPATSGSCRETGYTICRSARGDHLVLDAGPHGFLNGGHAHADALAVTLTVRSRPLLVDPGTGSYTVDPVARDRFRSSVLHNTATIDGRSQSVPSGPFHWAHVADAERLAWCTTPAFDYVEGRHDGYAPLEHRRTIFARPGCWVIVDRILGSGSHRVDLHWHLDPRWRATPIDAGVVRCDTGDATPVWITSLDGGLEAHGPTGGDSGLGWVAPEYGAIRRSTTLRARREGPVPCAFATLIVEGDTRPDARLLPVLADGVADPLAIAIRLGAGDALETLIFGPALPIVDGARVARPRRVAGDLETDAAFLWHRPRTVEPGHRVSMLDGSGVRRADGRVLIGLRATTPFGERDV
jgi:hypothetical protein